MQKLDEMNNIIQLKVQNYQNTYETISTRFTWTIISNDPKIAKARRNLDVSYVAL